MTPPSETTLPPTEAVLVRTTEPPTATMWLPTSPLTVIWPPMVTTLRTFWPSSITTSLLILMMLSSSAALPKAAGPKSRISRIQMTMPNFIPFISICYPYASLPRPGSVPYPAGRPASGGLPSLAEVFKHPGHDGQDDDRDDDQG